MASADPPDPDPPDPALGPTLSATPRDAASGTTDPVHAATAPAPRDLAVALVIGERVGERYLVRSFLGEGGMGAVYRALDETLGEEVALKVVRGVGIDTLRDEVRLAQKVTHTNVCRTYDLEEAGGHHFVKMEFVDGETLAARIARTGKLAVDEAVRIARAIADGLGAAHAKGIVHRDLKPGNIMLSGDRAVLMDFGIAHLIASPTSGIAGTFGYMAPEQITEGTIDGRADLYALGCVLHEMLAGEPLFGGKRLELAIRHVSVRPPDIRSLRPEVPGWLARALRDLLAKVPERRDRGVARLRAGKRSRAWVVAAIGIALAVVGAIVMSRATREPTWQPDVASFEPYEEDGSTTSISADGAWLVFDSDRAQRGVARLYAMARATGETVALATPPGIEPAGPRWTRDGKALLYQAVVPGGDHVYRQAIAGTPPALAGAPVDLGFGVMPDACGDDAIVYVDSSPLTKRVMVLDHDGNRQVLATVAHNETLSLPRCDPTGSRVVFVRGVASSWSSGNDVFVVDRVGVTTQLTTDHASSTAMFTADGRSIVFAAKHGDRRDLFEVPATGGTPRPLLVHDAGAAMDMSRDGRVVVFHRDDTSTHPVIGEANLPRPITSRRGDYFWARPAGPDRIIARHATGTSSEIVTVRLRDGAITVLAPGYTGFPSLDNTRVYFRSEAASNVLMVVPIDGGPATVVASLPGAIMSGADGPDGQHLGIETRPGVVEAYRVAGGHAEAEGAPGLVTVAPSGGWRAVTVLFAKSGGDAPARLLLIPPGAALSAPSRELEVGSVYNLWLDAHRIGYCGDGRCHVLDVATGVAQDVPAYPRFYEHGAIVTPDGAHIVDSEVVSRITRHAVVNFDAWPR